MADQPRLFPTIHATLRVRHYSRRTEEAYVGWIKRFILFHNKRHPASMGGDEVNAFLTSLAVDGNVSASTQGQALSALLFLYRYVFNDPLPWLNDVIRASRPLYVPAVMTPEEVRALLKKMTGTPKLIALLLYGGGLRLLECLQLRIKDVHFGRSELYVRDTKGKRDRVTTLSERVQPALKEHMELVRALHQLEIV